MQHRREGIALLITVMFVIVITVAIGIGLKQVNVASDVVQEENFMYQSNIIVEDILNILKNSPEIQAAVENNSSAALNMLLAQAAFIPFDLDGVDVIMKIKSARAKLNPNILDTNNTEAFQTYFSSHGVNTQYVDILKDSMGHVKEDNSYYSNIFDTHPYLFRDYIASAKQLSMINDFYEREYNDNSLDKIDFKNLFYYSKDKNSSVDLNYATVPVWELMLGCPKERAELLASGGGVYESDADLELSDDEKHNLQKFAGKYDFYEPILLVELEIRQDNVSASISFEYNIENKKGSNFVYEI